MEPGLHPGGSGSQARCYPTQLHQMQTLGSLVNTRPRVLGVRQWPLLPLYPPRPSRDQPAARGNTTSNQLCSPWDPRLLTGSASRATPRVSVCAPGFSRALESRFGVRPRVWVRACSSLGVCVCSRLGLHVFQYLCIPILHVCLCASVLCMCVHVPECDPVCAHVPVCPGMYACLQVWWTSSRVPACVSWCTCMCSCDMAVRVHLHVWMRACESWCVCLLLSLCECASPCSRVSSQGACTRVSVCVSPRVFLVKGVCGLEKRSHCYSRFGK